MGEKPARKNDAGERDDDDADRSAEQTQAEEPTDGRSDAPIAPSGSVRVAGRAGQSRGQTRIEESGGSRGTGEGYVEYERGPDPRALSERYGMEVRAEAATKLQRLERELGGERVQRWADEGMSVETMGKPRDMRAFRERQAERSEEVPADIERRNEASRRRNEEQNREEPPAGETGVPDVVRRVVSSPGRSMDESVQREMEAKMGGEFSDVQLHTGTVAAAAADSIDARAFTVGNHVAFNRGEYRPDTENGKRLLAHELTHVRQQTAGAVSLLPAADADRPSAGVTVDTGVHVQPKLEVSSPDDPAEKEAEEVAQAVMEMDDEGATRAGVDSDASPRGGVSGGDADRAETGADEEGVDADGAEADADSAETEIAAESAETEPSDTESGGAGPERETGPADGVQQAPDADSADGTATESPGEATAGDPTLSAGGPGESSDGDGNISVGRRVLRALDAGVEGAADADDRPERPADGPVGLGRPESGTAPTGSGRRTGGQPVPDRTESAVEDAIRGGGRPLPPGTRTAFESKLGADLSDVRVHTGPAADEAARSMNAEAFTLGTDVVFRSEAAPVSARDGQRLLAHELAHVVQNSLTGSPDRVGTVRRQQADEGKDDYQEYLEGKVTMEKLGTREGLVEVVERAAQEVDSTEELFIKLMKSSKGWQTRYLLAGGMEVGLLDLMHFFHTAAEAYSGGAIDHALGGYAPVLWSSSGRAKMLGWGKEIEQWWAGGDSAFSPEDLPSNALGAEFGEYIGEVDPVPEQVPPRLNMFLKNLDIIDAPDELE